MKKILLSGPYMLPEIDRFRKVFECSGQKLIVPVVHERLEEKTVTGRLGREVLSQPKPFKIAGRKSTIEHYIGFRGSEGLSKYFNDALKPTYFVCHCESRNIFTLI